MLITNSFTASTISSHFFFISSLSFLNLSVIPLQKSVNSFFFLSTHFLKLKFLIFFQSFCKSLQNFKNILPTAFILGHIFCKSFIKSPAKTSTTLRTNFAINLNTPPSTVPTISAKVLNNILSPSNHGDNASFIAFHVLITLFLKSLFVCQRYVIAPTTIPITAAIPTTTGLIPNNPCIIGLTPNLFIPNATSFTKVITFLRGLNPFDTLDTILLHFDITK